MSIFGYARSLAGGPLQEQVAELVAAGAVRVFQEDDGVNEGSVKDFVLRTLTAGDTLLVTQLNHLAQSSRQLVNIFDGLSKNRVLFRSLREHWADSTCLRGR